MNEISTIANWLASHKQSTGNLQKKSFSKICYLEFNPELCFLNI